MRQFKTSKLKPPFTPSNSSMGATVHPIREMLTLITPSDFTRITQTLYRTLDWSKILINNFDFQFTSHSELPLQPKYMNPEGEWRNKQFSFEIQCFLNPYPSEIPENIQAIPPIIIAFVNLPEENI